MGCRPSKSSEPQVSDSPSVVSTQDVKLLTNAQKKLVRSTWAAFKEGDYIKDATYIYVVLFQEKPETVGLFAFVEDPSEEQLFTNPALETHLGRVTNTIGLAVDNMNDPATLATVAIELGKRHVDYGAKPEHLGSVVNGVIFALKRKLKDRFTDDAKQAWLELLAFIGTNMVQGMMAAEEQNVNTKLQASSEVH